MACPRCATEADLVKTGWCRACENAYDSWVRRHAADIIWVVMGGGVVIAVLGLGLPWLGVGSIVGGAAAFAGFGTIWSLQRLNDRRRRRQFLRGIALPRAYLPAPKS
jgi:hypothetical protein